MKIIYPALTVADKLNIMLDSVNIVNSIYTENIHNDDNNDLMMRNYLHIQIMLEKPEINQSGEDLTEFIEVVNIGKIFLGIT